MDPYIEKAFQRLDEWRHLPAYRLEPRADVFFAAFMPELLHGRLGIPVREPIIPEFPLRRGTLYGEEVSGANASVKVDYLVVSEDGGKTYLVELKTDQASRRSGQDEYLDLAVNVGVKALTYGVLQIIRVTDEIYLPKYMHLLTRLDQLGWLELPDGLASRVCTGQSVPVESWLGDIEVSEQTARTRLEKLYIQPEDDPEVQCISFKEAAETIAATGSPLGQVFADHLIRWTATAGSTKPRG